MIISIRQILLLAAVVIFVLDAIKAWRLGINPISLVLPWLSVPICFSLTQVLLNRYIHQNTCQRQPMSTPSCSGPYQPTPGDCQRY
jgi:hypothetical protein